MKDVDVVIGCHKYLDLKQQSQPVQANIKKLGSEKESLLTRIRTADADVEVNNAVLLEKEGQLQNRQDTVNQIDDQIRTLNEDLLVSRERTAGLEQRAKTALAETELAETEQKRIQKQLAQIEDDRKTLNTGLEQARTAFAEREISAKASDEQIAVQKESTQVLRNRSFELIQKHSHEQAEISTLEARKDSLYSRSNEVAALRKKLSQELETNSKAVENLKKELLEGRNLVDENTLLNSTLQESVQNVRNRLETDRDEFSTVESTLATVEKERALLDRMHRQYEGYAQGVRNLLADGTEATGLQGVIADHISIEKEYESLIATYLDNMLQYVVADHEKDVLDSIRYLREHESGRVSFILLDRLKSRPAPSELPFEDDGIIGRASSFVTASENLEPVIVHLLSRVVLVTDLETAFRLSPVFDTNQDWKLLTSDGEIIDPAGLLTGGSTVENESDLLRRKERINTLDGELKTYQVKRDKMAGEIEELSDELATLTERQSTTEQFLAKSQSKVMELENHEKQYDFELTRLNGQDEGLENEAESLAKQLKISEEESAKHSIDLEELTQNRTSIEDEVQENQEMLDELEIGRQRLSEAAHEARIALVSLESRSNELGTTDEFLSQENDRLTKVLLQRKAETLEAGEQTKKLKISQENHEKKLEVLYKSRREREIDRDAVLEEHRNLQDEVRGIQQKVGEGRNALTQVQEQVHQAELEVAELYMKSNEVRRQLMENHGTDPEEMDIPPQIDELEDYTSDAAQTLRHGIQSKVDELGPINMAAVEEYKVTKERLDFLQQQQTDLIEAKENLEKTIVKMNKAARARFMTTFEQVRKNFMTTFQTLFDGGEADLKLEEGDALETGIEIMARPGGKRLQSLALLSGGETALTAIALLFAIYLVKPSPFCVFDEVDAPLDDANVRRFASALRQFTNETQFLVVTHNKRTMEAADYLYGITMEEPGLSKMVSVRLENTAAEQLEPTAAQG